MTVHGNLDDIESFIREQKSKIWEEKKRLSVTSNSSFREGFPELSVSFTSGNNDGYTGAKNSVSEELLCAEPFHPDKSPNVDDNFFDLCFGKENNRNLRKGSPDVTLPPNQREKEKEKLAELFTRSPYLVLGESSFDDDTEVKKYTSPRKIVHHNPVEQYKEDYFGINQDKTETEGADFDDLLAFAEQESQMVRFGEYSPNNPHIVSTGQGLLGLGEYEEKRRQLMERKKREYKEYLTRAKTFFEGETSKSTKHLSPTLSLEDEARKVENSYTPRSLDVQHTSSEENAQSTSRLPDIQVASRLSDYQDFDRLTAYHNTARIADIHSTGTQTDNQSTGTQTDVTALRITNPVREQEFMWPSKVESSSVSTVSLGEATYVPASGMREDLHVLRKSSSAPQEHGIVRLPQPVITTSPVKFKSATSRDQLEAELRRRSSGYRPSFFEGSIIRRVDTEGLSPEEIQRRADRLHISQTTDQLPDPKRRHEAYQEELRKQIEERKKAEEERKKKEKLEEELFLLKVKEQQEKLQREYEEEQYKRKSKIEERRRKTEEFQLRQEEIRKESEKQRQEEIKKKIEAKRHKPFVKENEDESEDTNIPASLKPPNEFTIPILRVESPPIPSLRSRAPSRNRKPPPTQSEAMNKVESKWEVPATETDVVTVADARRERADIFSETQHTNVLTQLGAMRRHLQLEQLKMEEELKKKQAALAVGLTPPAAPLIRQKGDNTVSRTRD